MLPRKVEESGGDSFPLGYIWGNIYYILYMIILTLLGYYIKYSFLKSILKQSTESTGILSVLSLV